MKRVPFLESHTGRRDPELAVERVMRVLCVMLGAPGCPAADQGCQLTNLSIAFKHIEASMV